MGNSGSKKKKGRSEHGSPSRTGRRATVSKGISFDDDNSNDNNNGAMDAARSSSNSWHGRRQSSTQRSQNQHQRSAHRQGRRAEEEAEDPSQTNASIVSNYSRVNADYAEIEPSAPKLEMTALTPSHTNPWRSIRHKSARPKKKVLGSLSVLLDDDARDSPWYCLAFDKEDAMLLLEENADRLEDGAFVVTSSGLDFAMLTLLHKGALVNVPIKNDEDGLYIHATTTATQSAKKDRRCRSCACLSDLIDQLASGKPRYLPCLLQPRALDREEYLEVMADVQIQEATPNVSYDLGHAATGDYGVGTTSPPYRSAFADATGYDNIGVSSPPSVYYAQANNVSMDTVVDDPNTDVFMSLKGHHAYDEVSGGVGANTSADSDDARLRLAHASPMRSDTAPPPPPGDEGFIRISHTCLNGQGKVKGITFQPCQQSEWFFVGLSNVLNNYHGDKDLHYNDIDFCIFCRGSGKATARECEDEVGPFISYRPGDTFSIRVRQESKHRSVVEYVHNGSVFYTSTRRPSYPLWVDQAFHPASLGVEIIKNVKWT
ncbi:hypothetical protein PTSG_03348 [Salpingoeca rosetta]|uniref:SH2 domain-containing protein n=1 Tax=Salpingoeca rosetta (strain ATCC 50818 / BSB-021) TaxID=946362 RepID=F2U4X1_SALR5|nr:uncharacterized protein PTSG_03348 [Salpingoeca rosetta]EGD82687.1 hypothetical protein PTSG_03348 [Salpingoeca rosetta]|eukprot:XP_004995923.1 hypothetical protein PTSG_03348 [Salpingoeca rosetta]